MILVCCFGGFNERRFFSRLGLLALIHSSLVGIGGRSESASPDRTVTGASTCSMSISIIIVGRCSSARGIRGIRSLSGAERIDEPFFVTPKSGGSFLCSCILDTEYYQHWFVTVLDLEFSDGLFAPMMMRLARKGDCIHSVDHARHPRGSLIESLQWSNISDSKATC